MRLDRQQFIHAAKFIKPAILDSEETSPSTYVHCLSEGDKMILTSTNGNCGKRVFLTRPVAPIDFEKDNGIEPDENEEFLIPKPCFEAFQTLCEKHNAKLKDKIKRDVTLSFIDIFPRKLESFTEFLEFTPPPYTFPDLGMYFDMKKAPISEFIGLTAHMETTLKEFDKHHPVESSLSNNVIHIQQFNGAYQAWFLVRAEDE